ncbi:hypothetical protein [Streptomyces sp. LN699]|uniref:hypothetical protein n=1 Tax=Streptomyces sp. LN699 TaxID=3112981 RepID=UPI003711FDF8
MRSRARSRRPCTTPSAVSFSDLSIAARNEAPTPKGHLVILTSDGVHDQMDPTVLNTLVHTHHNDAQALADALVAAPELVQRDFRAEELNEKWCGDIAYVRVPNE